MQIQFKVHGGGKDLFGDGFAIWYVRDRMEFGPVFGSKDYFVGLAIILDTYSNHNGAHNVSKYMYSPFTSYIRITITQTYNYLIHLNDNNSNV